MSENLENIDIPNRWTEAVEKIKSTGGTVLILGATDSGKSTFTRFAVDACLKAGKKVGFVDGDMGQSIVGPPTTIGLDYMRFGSDGRTVISSQFLYFVGSTSPNGHLLQTLAGVVRMVGKANQLGADNIIIDTTGLTHGGAARELKLQKINTLQPSIIIALQKSGEIEHLLKPHRNSVDSAIIRLPVSDKVKNKSLEMRRRYRAQSFRTYMNKGTRVDFSLEKVLVHGRGFSSGDRVTEKEVISLISKLLATDVIYCTKVSEEMFIITLADYYKGELYKIRARTKINNLIITPVSFLKNVIAGLIDKNGDTLAIGLFMYLNPDKDTISVYTPLRELDKVDLVKLGLVRINSLGEEISRFK